MGFWDSNGLQSNFGVPPESQWIPMGFRGFSGIPMDPNGILVCLCDPNGIFGVPLVSQWIPMGFLGLLCDPNGISGFLHDPTGSQWDFGVSLIPMGFIAFPEDLNGSQWDFGFLCDPNGSQWAFGVPPGSQWIPIGF